jgi:hypothetical protein
MKTGDTFEVKLQDFAVAEATVVELDGDEVYIDIPATRVKMKIRTSLAPPEQKAPEVDRIFAGQAESITGDREPTTMVSVPPAGTGDPDAPGMVEEPPEPPAPRKLTPQQEIDLAYQQNSSLRGMDFNTDALDREVPGE